MKILLINQAFYPDLVATGQQLTDLAEFLVSRGHEVTVIAGGHGYEDPTLRFFRTETHRGIRIHRLAYTAWGKTSRRRRALDFLSFYFNLCFKLLLTPGQDVVVGLTSPPLVAVAGNLFCLLKGGRFVYWVMDMNPEEAIAAGWLEENSPVARLLRGAARWCYRKSRRMVALDRFVKDKIVASYGIDPAKVDIIPPWAHDERIHPVPHEENRFRKTRGLESKFVVMYSGNHSPCHPLTTLLESARAMRDDSRTLFYFVGGGSLVREVRDYRERHSLANVVQLEYQPWDGLSESLSAADLHVVVMGEKFAGIVHPCKIYGILAVGRPFVLVGPRDCAIGDLIAESGLGWRVDHGDAVGLAAVIGKAKALTPEERGEIRRRSICLKDERYSQKTLCRLWADLLEKKP
ncbi:MAG: glycosyltransferase family 4 protein [Candidatus Omnitrophica bacterium]|nr:glycosyltransferase family 4 protein [Candidatus Omnitrophota bacterium]